MMLILYKLADHGLDFIWGPALVNAKINRKVILQSQFILGTFAAIVGSFIGTILTDYLKNPSFALMITSILRIIPNFMQLLFLQNPSFQNERFIMIHSLFENIIGSAVTGSMFSFLLETSDSRFPATSYAFMNSLNLIGMSLGEFSLGQLSFSLGFKEVVWIGISINLLFSYLVYLYSQSSKQSKD
jgi:predicted MFS family arabinose efflux permease